MFSLADTVVRATSPNMSELTAETNSKMKKSHWAFTIDENVDDVITTPMEGVKTKLLGYDCMMYIGPIEQADDIIPHPHRHCMMSYRGPHRACRKGRALDMIKSFLGRDEIAYLKGVVSSADRYIRYAWKSLDPAKTLVEKTIKRGIEDVADSGMAVTAKRLRTHLTNTAGAYFTQKNKTTIDLMLQEIHLLLPSRKVPFTVEAQGNRQSAMRSFNIMHRLIENAVNENGVTCTHSMLINEDPLVVRSTMMCLIALPYVCDRWEGGDNLPGIFLYGNACTGKSHLFKGSPCYAKIAQDAQGVSRFKKTGTQSAYLLDDIKSTFLDDKHNSATLRQLLLGDSVTVKIMGDTQDVCGWVVATSNECPAFLAPDNPPEDAVNWEVQCKAWQRRFIILEMTRTVDLDPVVVNWHHTSAKEAAIATFMLNYENLSEKLKEAFSVYHDHISRLLDDDWKLPFAEMVDQEEEYIETHVPLVQPKSYFDVMMSAPQPPVKKTRMAEFPPPTHPEEVTCPDECYAPCCYHKNVNKLY